MATEDQERRHNDRRQGDRRAVPRQPRDVLFPGSKQPQDEVRPPPPKGQGQCDRCGAYNPYTEAACERCGCLLPWAEAVGRRHGGSQSMRTGLYFIILALLAAAVYFAQQGYLNHIR